MSKTRTHLGFETPETQAAGAIPDAGKELRDVERVVAYAQVPKPRTSRSPVVSLGHLGMDVYVQGISRLLTAMEDYPKAVNDISRWWPGNLPTGGHQFFPRFPSRTSALPTGSPLQRPAPVGDDFIEIHYTKLHSTTLEEGQELALHLAMG